MNHPDIQSAFETLVELAERNAFPGFPSFQAFDVVYDENIEKLGLFEGDLPRRLVTTYGRIKAGRGMLQSIARGDFNDDQNRISSILDIQIKVWRLHINPEGQKLVEDLDAIGARKFWGLIA